MSFVRVSFTSNRGVTYNIIVSKVWIKMKGYVTIHHWLKMLMTVFVSDIHSITTKQDITNTPYN